MKINIKARLKNKTFITGVCALAVGFIYHVLALFDVVPRISQSEVIGVFGLLIDILAFIGVLADPTTEGFSDSDRAMTYCTDCDVRLNEKESYGNG